jgi:hypothetical protein
MGISRRKPREPEADPFYDMLFNMLIAFVFCFVVALLAFNPKNSKSGDIPAYAEFIVTLTWPDLNVNDLDLWVEDPAGNLVWFRQRDSGLMHLDRDDRGMTNDVIVVNGQQVVNPLNQEVVTIRGFAAGEYTVNVHYYESLDQKSVPANVSLLKVNPRAEVVYYGTLLMARKGDEQTAMRFTLDAKGNVLGVNTLPKSIVERSQK